MANKLKGKNKSLKSPDTQSKKSTIINSKYFPIAVISILFIIIYPNIFDQKLAILGDNASYYILGKSLAAGEGYADLSSAAMKPHNHYPPGYPLIISIIITINYSLEAVKLINGIFLFIALLLLFKIFEAITGDRKIALVGIVLLIFNSHLLYYSTIIMSEVSFLLFSALGIWLLIKLDFQKPIHKNGLFYLSLLSLVAAVYIRTAGIALVGGVLLLLLVNKNWKYLLGYTIGFLILYLPWVIRGLNLGGSSYTRQLKMINPYRPELGMADFGDLITRIITNISRYISKEIPSVTMPFIETNYREVSNFGDYLIGLIIIGLAIYGLMKLKKFRWLIIFYLLASAGILLFWPSTWFGIRFILPLTPFILISVLFGIKLLIDKFLKINALLLCVFAIFFIPSVIKLRKSSKAPYAANWQNYFEIANWIKENEKSKVLVSCGKPILFHVYSNQFTVRYKFTSDDQELIADLEDRNVKYVVLDKVYANSARYLLPAVRNNQDRFKVILKLENPDTYLFEINDKMETFKPGVLQFDFDKNTLNVDAIEKLNQLVVFLKGSDANVKISGYTDTYGPEDHNLFLSQKRAKTAYDYLVKEGIKQEQLSYQGYGEANPIADNSTLASRKLNRRVEFDITQ
ncbi:MAG: OmpA family protein [Ignavibacteria bacterium]|nr:OmpA family protein [Ignavibacteria bacterium]